MTAEIEKMPAEMERRIQAAETLQEKGSLFALNMLENDFHLQGVKHSSEPWAVTPPPMGACLRDYVLGMVYDHVVGKLGLKGHIEGNRLIFTA